MTDLKEYSLGVPEHHDKYPHRSAARKMIFEIPIASKDDTVGSALGRIRNNIEKIKTIDYVYVINEEKQLIGIISFKDLLKYSKTTKIVNVMQRNLVTASPETDQEKVADLAVKHNIKSVPIIENKKLIGIVPIEQILLTINRALREDIFHLAGIHKSHIKYENTLVVPFFQSILHRIPYLLIGLLGITTAAAFVSIFEATLEKYIILVFFLPAIVYMSGALGTQHQTLFVRDLAVLGKELNLKKYFFKQLCIGSLLALLISMVIFLVITFFWKQTLMALIISTAMFISLVVTSFVGLITTLSISRFKLDPALGSGPLGTVISDVVSIVIYFTVAYVFLGGLL